MCIPEKFHPNLPAKFINTSRQPRRYKRIYKKKAGLRAGERYTLGGAFNSLFFTHLIAINLLFFILTLFNYYYLLFYLAGYIFILFQFLKRA